VLVVLQIKALKISFTYIKNQLFAITYNIILFRCLNYERWACKWVN